MFDATLRNLPFLLGGLLVTFKLAAFAVSGGIFLGILVGLARISRKKWIYYPITLQPTEGEALRCQKP